MTTIRAAAIQLRVLSCTAGTGPSSASSRRSTNWQRVALQFATFRKLSFPIIRILRVIVLVAFNADGKAQRLVVNHRPRSSVLEMSRAMLERFAGTPLAKHWEGTP